MSLWWTDNERDDIFWRSSQSGGRATVRGRKKLTTSGSYGDFMATDPLGIPFLQVFTPEIKRGYSRHSLQDLLDQSPHHALQMWEGWMMQASAAHKLAGSLSWLLIVRRDQRATLIALPTDYYRRLDPRAMSRPNVRIRVPSKIRTGGQNWDTVVTPLESFLEVASPWSIINLLEQGNE